MLDRQDQMLGKMDLMLDKQDNLADKIDEAKNEIVTEIKDRSSDFKNEHRGLASRIESNMAQVKAKIVF